MRLTARERILLHLLEAAPAAETVEVPLEMSQEGIARAIWVDLRHLPQSIRPLVEEGLIRERRAHVRGVRQRRKTYDLSYAGKVEAIRLRGRARAESIRLRDSNGFRNSTIGEVLDTTTGGVSLLAISRLVSERGYLDLASLGPPSHRLVEMVSEAPRVDGFVGRERELTAVLRDDGPRVFVVLGIAGIGKSWFGAMACRGLHDQKNLYWDRIRPWDHPQSILARLGRFLFTLGKPGLQSVLARGDVALSAQVLREDLSGSNALLVFDDAHEGTPEVSSFFRLLKESLEQAADVRALLLTRHALSFYDRRDVRLGGLVEEIELKGLDSDQVVTLLSGEEHVESLLAFADRHGGHPLFLQLLVGIHRSPLEPLAALGDFHRFMLEEIYSELSPEARRAMKLVSLFRVPIPWEVLVEDLAIPHDVLLGLSNRFLLRRIDEDRYEVHDAVREFFGSLVASAERKDLSRIAATPLERLAKRAFESGSFLACVDFASDALNLAESPPRKAGLWEMLGEAYARLGDLLASVTAFREALRVAGEPETAARLHRKIADEFLSRMDWSSAEAAIEAGFRALGALGTAERGWLELMRARFAAGNGKPGEAHTQSTAAFRIFQVAGELRGQAYALGEMARAEMDRGEVADAEAHLLEALRIARSGDDPLLLERILLRLAWVVGWGRGDTEQTSKYYAEIDALARQTGNPEIHGFTLANRGFFELLFKADFQAAEDYLLKAGEFARRRYAVGEVLGSTEGIAVVRYYQGRYEEARAMLEDVIAQRRHLGHSADAIETIGYLAESCLLAGDLPAFRAVVAQSEEADLSAWREIEPSTIGAFRAVVALLDGDRGLALRLLDEAGRRAKMPEALHYHRIASVVLTITGDLAAGERHRQRAKDLAASHSRQAFLSTFDDRERRMSDVVLASLSHP